jgi:outer membrane protein W
MRSLKISFATSVLVCAFAATAFAQDAAPADPAAAPAAEPTPAAAPAPVTTDTSATVTTDSNASTGKFVIGARLGYGIGLGDIMKDLAMSDNVSGHIPIWLDLGYMVTPNIMVGLYGQYGIGIPSADECDASGVSCSASVIRLGAQAQYHLSPAEKLDPWFGLGIGYEWGSITAEGGGQKQSLSVRGFEFLNLQGGADYKLAPNFGIGPFLSFSLGQYSNYSTEVTGGGSQSGSISDISDTTMHEWLTFGVRGAFTL